MIQILSTHRTSQEFHEARGAGNPGTCGEDPETTCPVRPGEAAFVALENGTPVARALAQPMLFRPSTGNIALFECIDDQNLAIALLERCQRHLLDRGIRTIVGPMDGDTWHAYRTADPSVHAPFLLDRRTPPWHGDLFRAAGYVVCDRYLSTRIPAEHLSWGRLERSLPRIQASGIDLRTLDTGDWDGELERIHELSLEAFADNSWSEPLDLESFRRLYHPWRDQLPTDGILIACRDGRTLAYAVSCPQTLQDGSRQTIIKTVASSRCAQARGLGALLVECLHRKAHLEGHRGVVHALMHSANPSNRILSSHGETIRTYSLWRKDPR